VQNSEHSPEDDFDTDVKAEAAENVGDEHDKKIKRMWKGQGSEKPSPIGTLCVSKKQRTISLSEELRTKLGENAHKNLPCWVPYARKLLAVRAPTANRSANMKGTRITGEICQR